jgi:hypothetical protein
VSMIDRANLPCSLEEVVLDSPQEVSTLLVWAAIMDITKRVEMRKVIGFVMHFFPTGIFACASRPLVDAALDLMTACTTRQNPAKELEASILPQ